MEMAEQRPAGYQRWRGLLFLHWKVEPDLLRPLIPSALEVETFGGHAWVGLVPFAMDRVRPRWSPPVPGVSWFLETNLRTYVTGRGIDPGVWFFSLDANSRLAVAVARRVWHLNYYHARMRMDVGRNSVRYDSDGRTGGGEAAYRIEATVPEESETRPAAEGTLEHFLVERYLLYARGRDGRLHSGRVRHRPYHVAPARVMRCDQRLSDAAGITLPHPPESALYAPMVDVTVYPLSPSDGASATEATEPATDPNQDP